MNPDPGGNQIRIRPDPDPPGHFVAIEKICCQIDFTVSHMINIELFQ